MKLAEAYHYLNETSYTLRTFIHLPKTFGDVNNQVLFEKLKLYKIQETLLGQKLPKKSKMRCCCRPC